jgi:hypothetical protein
VAAALRGHKRLVLEGASPAARAAVAQSLLNGLEHLLNGDVAALLVLEQPAKASVLRRYGARAGLAVAVVAGAVLLPFMLPSLISDPDRFRATALIVALFSLVSPDVKTASETLRSFGGGK